MEEMYSVEQAAKRLGGVSKYTIQAWLSKGKLKRTKVGSRTMIRECDLQEMLVVGGKSENHRTRQAETSVGETPMNEV